MDHKVNPNLMTSLLCMSMRVLADEQESSFSKPRSPVLSAYKFTCQFRLKHAQKVLKKGLTGNQTAQVFSNDEANFSLLISVQNYKTIIGPVYLI